MNNNLKVILGTVAGIMIGGLTVVGANQAIQAIQNTEIKVSLFDDEYVNLVDPTTGERQYPIIYHDRTYLPLRSIAELLGYNVMWDGTNNEINLDKNINGEIGFYLLPKLKAFVDNPAFYEIFKNVDYNKYGQEHFVFSTNDVKYENDHLVSNNFVLNYAIHELLQNEDSSKYFYDDGKSMGFNAFFSVPKDDVKNSIVENFGNISYMDGNVKNDLSYGYYTSLSSEFEFSGDSYNGGNMPGGGLWFPSIKYYFDTIDYQNNRIVLNLRVGFLKNAKFDDNYDLLYEEVYQDYDGKEKAFNDGEYNSVTKDKLNILSLSFEKGENDSYILKEFSILQPGYGETGGSWRGI